MQIWWELKERQKRQASRNLGTDGGKKNENKKKTIYIITEQGENQIKQTIKQKQIEGGTYGLKRVQFYAKK